jgi:hypothetical protein
MGIYKGRSPFFEHGGYTRGVSPCSYAGIRPGPQDRTGSIDRKHEE